jgi:hypothetical protein
MRTTTIPAIAAALLAVAGCTPTTTTQVWPAEDRPVEAAGSPASRLHVDVLTGTRSSPAPPHDPDVARQVVTAEAAPPPPQPPSPHRPSSTGHPLAAAPSVVEPDATDATDADNDDSRRLGGKWPSDGQGVAAVAELERRFAAEGLTVLDVDVRPAADPDIGGDAGNGVRLEVVVVHTSGHSHPHQSVYLATLADHDGGWQVIELEARP